MEKDSSQIACICHEAGEIFGDARKKMTSEEFRAIRKQLDLTQAELGKIMSISQHGLSIIENGKRKPTKIMAAFLRYIQANRLPGTKGDV
ncbi:MAG: helix-turn-helix transcriptional regulator [Desulfobulbus sp.]|nr:helix-turn-helix transcriptional regulator [Desulfobulbus sp.]